MLTVASLHSVGLSCSKDLYIVLWLQASRRKDWIISKLLKVKNLKIQAVSTYSSLTTDFFNQKQFLWPRMRGQMFKKMRYMSWSMYSQYPAICLKINRGNFQNFNHISWTFILQSSLQNHEHSPLRPVVSFTEECIKCLAKLTVIINKTSYNNF